MATALPSPGASPPAAAAPAKARPARPLPWLKPAVFTGALVPLAAIVIQVARGSLGANPVAEALNQLGLLALIFLIASLACTPLKLLFGWTWPMRVRKMLGLFGFFYASLHLATYAGLDQVLNWGAIFEDVTTRKFIAVGFLAFLLLVPLAVTSTSGMLKRLGAARWRRLHKLSYVAAALGIVHFVWRVKRDVSEPVIYGVILGALLALRFLPSRAARAGSPGRPNQKPPAANPSP